MEKVKIKKGLHSFVEEIGRYSVTSGFHYVVERKEERIEIVHHNGKWRVIMLPHKIIIKAGDVKAGDTLEIRRTTMRLNGKEVEEICTTVQCYDRKKLIKKIVFAIALYNEPFWVLRWISG